MYIFNKFHVQYNNNRTFKILTSNGKSKVIPLLLTDHHTMKLHWGSGGVTLRIDSALDGGE
jgi:hypothetical protein